MAKEKETPVETETAQETTEAVVPEVNVNAGRKARWEAFLAKYEAQNPVKYASRKENGELDKIPESFV